MIALNDLPKLWKLSEIRISQNQIKIFDELIYAPITYHLNSLVLKDFSNFLKRHLYEQPSNFHISNSDCLPWITWVFVKTILQLNERLQRLAKFAWFWKRNKIFIWNKPWIKGWNTASLRHREHLKINFLSYIHYS